MNSYSLAGKRLLVLGGLSQNIVAIIRARELGCHVTVVDFIENSPGKAFADESHLISITDTQKIIEVCKKTEINGVINYCIDPGQKPYQEICDILGLPCYGKPEEFEILTNKDVFHHTCTKYGVDVIPRFRINHSDFTLNAKIDEYPVIIKPADGRASKGISICESESDLKCCIQHALHFSDRKRVIVEKFIDAPEVCAKYFVCDGIPYLTSFSDTHTGSSKGQRTAINAKFYPSKYYLEFKEGADQAIREMITGIGIKNGPISMTGFYDQKKFKFFDPSFRLGGAQQWRIESYFSGIDTSEVLTRFALTGSCGLGESANNLETNFIDNVAGQIFILVQPGRINKIKGFENAIKTRGVIGHYFNHAEGDIVSQIGTTDHVVLTFHIVAPSKNELITRMSEIQDLIEINDDDGDSMLLPKFDLNLL